jgi:hypothetical protein
MNILNQLNSYNNLKKETAKLIPGFKLVAVTRR